MGGDRSLAALNAELLEIERFLRRTCSQFANRMSDLRIALEAQPLRTDAAAGGRAALTRRLAALHASYTALIDAALIPNIANIANDGSSGPMDRVAAADARFKEEVRKFARLGEGEEEKEGMSGGGMSGWLSSLKDACMPMVNAVKIAGAAVVVVVAAPSLALYAAAVRGFFSTGSTLQADRDGVKIDPASTIKRAVSRLVDAAARYTYIREDGSFVLRNVGSMFGSITLHAHRSLSRLTGRDTVIVGEEEAARSGGKEEDANFEVYSRPLRRLLDHLASVHLPRYEWSVWEGVKPAHGDPRVADLTQAYKATFQDAVNDFLFGGGGGSNEYENGLDFIMRACFFLPDGSAATSYHKHRRFDGEVDGYNMRRFGHRVRRGWGWSMGDDTKVADDHVPQTIAGLLGAIEYERQTEKRALSPAGEKLRSFLTLTTTTTTTTPLLKAEELPEVVTACEMMHAVTQLLVRISPHMPNYSQWIDDCLLSSGGRTRDAVPPHLLDLLLMLRAHLLTPGRIRITGPGHREYSIMEAGDSFVRRALGAALLRGHWLAGAGAGAAD